MTTRVKALFLRATGVLLSVSVLAGCSGIKPYPDSFEKNLRVSTETDSGSVFSSVRANVDIYRLNAQCQAEYQGTVALDKPSMAIGLPVDRTSYLVIGFDSASWLANSSSRVSYDTLLTPRAGLGYDMEVSYVDDIYNVAIVETRPGIAGRREIQKLTLDDCIPR
jgi:hypothetical protein